jgi:integrase
VEKAKKPGRYCDGGGLWLQVSQWGTKSWIFQYSSPTETKKRNGREVGRVRQLGLGAYGKHDVTLADAREKAGELRKQVRAGLDPINTHRLQREQLRLQKARHVTFAQCAEQYISAHQSAWRNDKHREQWRATLRTYAFPSIGDIKVDEVDTVLVRKVLEPIWSGKPETAGRLRGRIERVLSFAKAQGLHSGENPARWKGHLDNLLPRVSKIKNVRHHPALPYVELPEFMLELRDRPTISARALEFTILTAVRTSEAINARWSEFDLNEKTWTVPPERMKTGKKHRVPLSDRAVELLRDLPREKGSEFVFIGGREGAALSNMAMLECLRELRPGLTVHGFRSTFRTWAAERTNYPHHVCEQALAHVISDAVVRSYQRGDLFEKRRRLMHEWSRYCGQKPVAKSDNVRQLRERQS